MDARARARAHTHIQAWGLVTAEEMRLGRNKIGRVKILKEDRMQENGKEEKRMQSN